MRDVVQAIVAALEHTDRTSHIAEALHCCPAALEWTGQTCYSSDMPCDTGRSQHLADLATVVGATTYLCGTGGMRYLEQERFEIRGLDDIPFRTSERALWLLAATAGRLPRHAARA